MGRNLAKMARKQRERTAAAVHKKDVDRRESGVKNRRHGPLPALPEDLRSRTISVRLNPRELEELDRQRVKFDPTNVLKRPTERSRYQRGEWLRMSFLGVRPDVLMVMSPVVV